MSSDTSGIEEISQLEEALRLEREHAQEEHSLLLKKAPLQERVEKGYTWQPIEIAEQGYGLGDYPYIIAARHKNLGHPHQFSPGKSAELYAIDGDGSQQLSGMVQFADDDKLKIIFYVDDLPDWVDKERLGVNVGFDEKTFSEMSRALEIVRKSEEKHIIQLRKILTGRSTPSPNRNEHPITLPQLNDSQNSALNLALNCEEVAAIHGPPGTGKTTTIISLLAQLSKKEKQVLVCAPSNAAVDLLARKAHEKGLKVVRIGNLARMDERVFPLTLEQQVANHNRSKEIKKAKQQAQELRKMAGKYKRNFGREEREQRRLLYKEAKDIAKDALLLEDHIIEDLLNNANVIATTLVGASSRSLHKYSFSTVVIDEAAQAMAPATWIPIIKSSRVIFAGDPHQLPPTIKNPKAVEAGLAISLLETLVEGKEQVQMLKTQYRMHQDIMAHSNASFYGGNLEAHDSVAAWHLAPPNELPIEFVDTAGCSFDEAQKGESGSFYNEGEADLVIKHLRSMGDLEEGTSIGVISPYSAQVSLLKDTLKKEGLSHVRCQTIDSFQGQESDVIYISMVRCNDSSTIGFLKDYRRMNVAMTRAKKKLVLIGDSATLGSDAFYQRLMDDLEPKGYYKTAWEYLY